jgi:hypothetical protein
MDNDVRTTFFDDVNSGFSFEFTTPKPKHLKDLNTEPIISDNLICEVPMRNVTQRGVFSLHNQTLAFYRVGNTEIPYIILELEFSVLEIRNPDEVNPDYGFRVTRDGLYIDFYAPSKDIIDRWVEKLRNVCILLDFHEDYKVTKKLGKGSFATVNQTILTGNSAVYRSIWVNQNMIKNHMPLRSLKRENLMLSQPKLRN